MTLARAAPLELTPSLGCVCLCAVAGLQPPDQADRVVSGEPIGRWALNRQIELSSARVSLVQLSSAHKLNPPTGDLKSIGRLDENNWPNSPMEFCA